VRFDRLEAAWVVCFGIIGVTAGLAAMRRDFTATAAADPIAATPPATTSTCASGARLRIIVIA
jgi:hypothetical protein